MKCCNCQRKARKNQGYCLECHAEKQRGYYAKGRRGKKTRIQARAHRMVARAVSSGRLRVLPCCVCSRASEAHHEDYRHPLAVIWLCRKHHRDIHKKR